MARGLPRGPWHVDFDTTAARVLGPLMAKFGFDGDGKKGGRATRRAVRLSPAGADVEIWADGERTTFIYQERVSIHGGAR